MAPSAKSAFAYFRTSSATNVGEGKDSQKRQRAAVQAFATRKGYEIIGTFADDAVSGEDDIATRPAFSAMLDALETNGTRTVICEDASRLARKMLVQEVAIAAMIGRGVTCWAAAGELELTNTEDEMRVMMRQVAGAFAQLEKTRLVKKLRAARERKRAAGLKVEGRKSIAEREGGAGRDVVTEARRLYRKNPKTGRRRSLRNIAVELFASGFVSGAGTPFAPTVVARLVRNTAAHR